VLKDTIQLSRQNGLAILTFNRPERLNAFNQSMSRRLEDLCQDIGSDPCIRVVLLRGAGEAFMSGTDLCELYHHLDLVAAEVQLMVRQFNSCILMLREMDKLVIAAVHGFVMGTGMAIMLAADLVLACANTKFSLGYNRIALSPIGAISYLLPRIVGTKKAMELLVMSDIFDVELAKSHGLVNWAVHQSEYEEKLQNIVEHLLNSPFVAIQQTKQLVNSAWHRKLNTQLQLESESFSKCVNTKDFKTAVRAFISKRIPEFEGI
jgi:2-(1,2-epoxy-1,2-dihydrophenyl)acetyl-CoA isomerase